MNDKSFRYKLIRIFILVTVGIFIVVLFPMGIVPSPMLTLQIIVLGILCTIVSLVLFSKSEPSKKSYLLRHAIHLVLTVVLVIGYSVFCGWAEADKLWQWIGVGMSVIMITIFVIAITYFIDKRSAARIQKGLERYKQNNK